MQIFGKHSLEAARSYSAMGLLQKEKGNLTNAKWFLKRALQIRTDELGPDHEETKFVMSRLEDLAKFQPNFALKSRRI